MAMALAGVQEIFRSRELFQSLVWRELTARYKGSVLGFAWSFLNPLLMIAIYSFVFKQIYRNNDPVFPVFVFTGLLAWNWFAVATVNCSGCVIGNAGLVKKVYFPIEVLPTVLVTTNFINYLLSLPILLIFMLAFGKAPGWAIVYLPVLWIIQYLLIWGLGAIMATAMVFFRDVEQLLSAIMTAWFFLTPVLYTVDMVPETHRNWIMLNPVAPVIAGYRDILLQNTAPDWRYVGYSAAVAGVVFLIGFSVFRRFKYSFHEVV